MTTNPHVAIGDDNTPHLHELDVSSPESPACIQLACRADEDTCYLLSFTGYRSGMDADTYRPDAAEINQAIGELVRSTRECETLRLETGEPPNPGREFSVPSPAKAKCRTIVHAYVFSFATFRLGTPTVGQLRQLFFFLSRCHPLS